MIQSAFHPENSPEYAAQLAEWHALAPPKPSAMTLRSWLHWQWRRYLHLGDAPVSIEDEYNRLAAP